MLFWVLYTARGKSYKGCISMVVCSVPFLEDGAASWFPPASISWTGGGLTMVMGMAELLDRCPFISLCSWHIAHQCMQQCTRHGSHGEFCKQAVEIWVNNTWFSSMNDTAKGGIHKRPAASSEMPNYKRSVRQPYTCLYTGRSQFSTVVVIMRFGNT